MFDELSREPSRQRIVIENKHNYKGPGIYVGRPSILGNPYTHLKKKTKAEIQVPTLRDALLGYRKWLTFQLLNPESPQSQSLLWLVELYKLSSAQRPLRLICWCSPEPCHAEFIRDMILATFYEQTSSPTQEKVWPYT